jgi:hypothetical protein
VSIVEKTLSLRTRELRKAPVSVLLSNMIRRFSGSTFITGSTFNPSHAVETERQRDRETERQRQRDRETERQRDREAERQRDREKGDGNATVFIHGLSPTPPPTTTTTTTYYTVLCYHDIMD